MKKTITAKIDIQNGLPEKKVIDYQVEADIYGPFAIHRSIWLNHDGTRHEGDFLPDIKWSVTHIPTGALIEFTATKSNAVIAMRALRSLPVPWSEMVYSDAVNYKKHILPTLVDLAMDGVIWMGADTIEHYRSLLKLDGWVHNCRYGNETEHMPL